jgi:hAT family C-terminal dimerisation region
VGVQPAVAFRRTQGIYSIGGLAKLISTMQQLAFDHLCIPATSCEAERAFSGCNIQSLITEAA